VGVAEREDLKNKARRFKEFRNLNELSRLLALPDAEKAKRGLVHTPAEIAHQTSGDPNIYFSCGDSGHARL